MTALDTGLLDPGTAAAGDDATLVGDGAVVAAMIEVEAALLDALSSVGAAPDGAGDGVRAVDPPDAEALAAAALGTGNPVVPLIAAIRSDVPADVADAVHFGATSQDVVDSALMLVAKGVRRRLLERLDAVTHALAALADDHRGTVLAGRTLGQQAAPTTLGLRAAVLLAGVRRARSRVVSAELPAQLGGSVGTAAVLADVLGDARAALVRDRFAEVLGLSASALPWHVERSAVVELAAALGQLIGALGRVGGEIVAGSRTEVGELVLTAGGGSSAMPQKVNPVAAALLVAAATRAPGLVATLFVAQLAPDDRPAGAWHAEWPALRELLRLALESTALAADALASIEVDVDRMRQNLRLADGAVHAERAQWALAAVLGRAEAAALVAQALAADVPFLDALDATLARRQDGEALRARVAAVTTDSGAVGLSDRFIDAVLQEAHS